MSTMKLIGKGSFSTVYRKSLDKVLIKSIDDVKECMSLGWFPKSNMFPKMVRVSKDGDYTFYESNYYPKVRSLKSELNSLDWEFYNILRNLSGYNNGKDSGYIQWIKQFETIPDKFKYRKTILLDVLNALAAYGDDMCFEISPRNVSVKNKRLILLDCFFFRSQLVSSRNRHRKILY